MRRLWCDVSGRQTRHLQELGATLPGFLSISSYGREVLRVWSTFVLLSEHHIGFIHPLSAVRLISCGSSREFRAVFCRRKRDRLRREKTSKTCDARDRGSSWTSADQVALGVDDSSPDGRESSTHD